MASKYQVYADLAGEQTKQVTQNMADWTGFLTTAGRLYKYPFEEQLMVHAQRPDAVAVAPLEFWNKPMNRFVKRGSKGIALLDNSRTKPKLKYVFDVVDTQDGWYNPHRPFLWEMKQEHQIPVIEALKVSYNIDGQTDLGLEQTMLGNSLGDYLYSTALNLSAQYYADNKHDINYAIENSFLDELDELNVSTVFRDALTISTAYVLMSRCNIDPAEYIENEYFQIVFDFNTPESVYALGKAVSDVSEEVLRGIEVTIKKYERQKAIELEGQHEHDNLHPTRGLSDTRYSDTRADGFAGQIRYDAEELPEQTQEDSVHDINHERNTVLPLSGNRETGERAVGADDREIGHTEPATLQRQQSNELDDTYEQSEKPSRGNHNQGTDLQLDIEPQEMPPNDELDGISASDDTITDEEINTYLARSTNIANGKFRIFSFFLHDHSTKEKADFLKNEYGTGGRTHAFPGIDHSYEDHNSKGLHFKKSDIFEPTAEVSLTWTNVANRIDKLIAENRYMSEAEINHIPTFEREHLGQTIMNFFSNLPLNVPRPAPLDEPLSGDFWADALKIGNTLDNPEIFSNILTAMHQIVDNTPKHDRLYESKQKAVERIESFEKGTFTLFPNLDSILANIPPHTPSQMVEQLTFNFPSEQEQIDTIRSTSQAESMETVKPTVTPPLEIPSQSTIITQEDIKQAITKWNGDTNSKLRVYEYMHKNSRARDTANFLKEEFGGNMGIFTVIKNGVEPVSIPWTKVQRHIGRLMNEDKFLSADEKMMTDNTPTTQSREAMPGDELYIHNKLYLIDTISPYDVRLYDPALNMNNPHIPPIKMSIFYREFDEAVANDPRNAHLLPLEPTEPAQQDELQSTSQQASEELAMKPTPSPTMTIADFVKYKLETGEKFSSAELFAEAAKAYGDTMANNAFTSKDAYDGMELGVNQYMLSMDNISHENVMKALDLLPTQTKRTADMEKFQQFSTPPSIAYLANWAANVNANDIVLEPSAGIGGIAIFAKKDGATVFVNELDKRRFEIIKNLPFDGFYNEDAEQINNIHGDKIEPTVIVMNPPFSSSAERNIHNTKIGAKHIEESLKILAPNGRLVAIVGQGMADDAPAFRNWWRGIKEQYNVKANIGIDGKNYNKYGTKFGIQMLVIDKNGATIEPVKTVFMENLTDLQNILGGIRNDRPSIQLENDNGNERNSATSTLLETATERESEHKPNDLVFDTAGRADTTVVGNGREQTFTSEINAISDGTAGAAPELASVGDDGLAPIIKAKRYNGNDERNDTGNGAGRTGVADSGKPLGHVKPRVKKELTDSIFENYEPQPLLLANVQPHPAKISESAAMSAIQPPPVTYKPNLSQEVIDKGILSDVQLEAVTYAGQSHSQTLPNGNTRGFFLGDGTGVGKGRTVTGIILDNYLQGRKKAVWLSENRGLVPDAKRDVSALFGNSDLVTEFEGGKKADKSLSNNEAILFATYSSLSKSFDQSDSNFEKIVNWLGKDFDGVIVFDEAHNMANSIATKGSRGIKKASQRGMAGLAIQEALPKAKIIYSSATGATEVENLRYADRLGLWGEGTAFPNGDVFISKIKAGGLAAMELIARDMKAMGVYLSRNISYEDVIYDKIVHELTPEQRTIYDELARSWQIVLQNLNKALETTNQDLDGTAKGKAYGAFWSTEQRFFNQILTAMQVPSMIADIQKQLDNDNSIVIQLVSTNESAQEKEFVRLQEQDLDLEDFDLTPKQMLMSYIESSFPIVQFEEYVDDNGNLRSKPVFDSEGNAVINREAVRQKEELLDKLGSIKVPASALDMVINHFGSDMVAENTGRKRRVVITDGKAKEENIAHKKQADVQAFQDGDKRIIVFSKAGGTGKSYHADKSAKNQQHRVHYLLQAGWQADAAVQGFGRSHRSNQVSAPTFVLVTTDLKGQMRFISTIAKRLDQLGALTKGQRQTGSQGLFTAGDNLENAFAADVLSLFYRDLIKNNISGVSNGVSIIEKLGLKDKLIDEYGDINTNAPELREVNKFLNRILSLEYHEQNALFDGYAERLHTATERAIQDGTLDKGLENYKADKVILKDTQDIKVDETTGATTKHYSLTAHNKVKPLHFFEINTKNSAFVGFYQNKNTGAVRAVFKTSSTTNEYGNVTDNYKLTGQDGNEYMPQYRLMNNWDELTPKKAEKLWDEAINELPEFHISNLHLIGGTVLPVWDKLPTENVRIYRVLTSDGDLLIGRVIPEDMIDATLYRLGATREKDNIETADLLKHIKNGNTLYLDNDWRIMQKRVSNEQRIEVIGADYLHSDLLTKKGVFTERIAYQTRYFIPAEKDTAKILDKVIKISPVSRIEKNNERIEAKPNVAKGKPSLLEALEKYSQKSKIEFNGDEKVSHSKDFNR